MRYLLIAVIALAACRVDPGSSGSAPQEYECDTTLDCPEDEVCAVGSCHDMGCDGRYTVVCCTSSGWGSVCHGQPVRPGDGFTPSWTADYPELSPEDAWSENYAGFDCLFHRCDML